MVEHKFFEITKGALEYNMLPESAEGEEFRYLLNCFVGDFIGLAILRAKSHLDQVAGGTMHDIHDVFPKKRTEEEDNAIAEVKARRGNARRMVQKDVLGFNFDGNKNAMILENPRLKALLQIMGEWIRLGARKKGIP